jgi:hypothetical protein
MRERDGWSAGSYYSTTAQTQCIAVVGWGYNLQKGCMAATTSSFTIARAVSDDKVNFEPPNDL